jgi:hypothetical protein
LTIACGDANVEFVLDARKESLHELQQGGFSVQPHDEPSESGAYLGRERYGYPTSFTPYHLLPEERPEKYQRVAASRT